MADIIAVIFDFDDTLAPDSTTKLLRSRGIDTDRFWRKDVSALVEQGWDASHAWLRLLLDNVGPDKPLGELTNADLREFGATLDDDYFEGIPEIFDDLKSQIAKPEFKDIEVEFYIVSGGLRDVIGRGLGSGQVLRRNLCLGTSWRGR